MVGVATANSPCGPYTYKSSWKPLGKDSRDMGLFQDGVLTVHILVVPQLIRIYIDEIIR